MDQNLIKQLEDDTPNDGMGLVWDGEKLTVVEDEFDNADIMDGRGGEYRYNRLKTPVATVYSVDKEDLLSEEKQIQNDDNCFLSQSENRFICISVDDRSYSQMLELHQSRLGEGTILNCEYEWLDNGICEKTFLEAPDGREMVGLRFIVSSSDSSVKIYEYGGLGNCSDIFAEAAMMGRRTIR